MACHERVMSEAKNESSGPGQNRTAITATCPPNFLDRVGFEPTSLQCECSTLPLSYRPSQKVGRVNECDVLPLNYRPVSGCWELNPGYRLPACHRLVFRGTQTRTGTKSSRRIRATITLYPGSGLWRAGRSLRTTAILHPVISCDPVFFLCHFISFHF